MAREKLTLLSDDFTITKEMVETNQPNEDFSDLQIINRLFRYYTFEENLTLEKSVEKIEQFLKDNKKEVSNGYVKELCENYTKNEKAFKPLRNLESIQLYESDVALIKSLPNQNTRKVYFVMMMENKIRRTLEVKEPDTMYYDFYQYTGYLDGTSLTRTESHEVLKYLQKYNLIDVPLFELNKMYYVYQPESGKAKYTVDSTKLDRKNLLQQFYDIFGKGLVIEDIMVIDLMQPVGHVIKHGKSEVQEYLKENGSKKDYSAITKVINHEKYLLGDFTAVVIKKDDKKYLLEVELLQRSMQPYTKKLFTTIPQMYTYYLFELLEYGSLNVLCDIPWQEIIKTRQKQVKQWKKEGFTDVTKEMLEVLKEEQGE